MDTTKQLQLADEIAASLLRLRDELFENRIATHAEVFFKINSCLYSGYPDPRHKKV